MNVETRAALGLVAAGLPANSVERFLPTLGLAAADDAEAVAAKIAALKTDLPAVFGATVTPLRRRQAASGEEGVTALELARRRFEGRQGSGYRFSEAGRAALARAGIRPREAGPGGSAA